MLLRTNGWPAAITNCPASCTTNDDGAMSRTQRPATGEHGADAERVREPRIQPAPDRQREHDVDEREDRREVTDGADVGVHDTCAVSVSIGAKLSQSSCVHAASSA